MSAFGIVFSNIHDKSIPELTRRRTMASVPFGCRYRLIDFALSNMVNAGISKVGVVVHNNYQSLLDHLGNGKDWDLARRSGGIKVLPPFITAYDSAEASKLYVTRLQALMGVMSFIEHCTEDYVVISDCDAICNLDVKDVLEKHEQTGADITFVTKKEYLSEEKAATRTFFESDNGRITRAYSQAKRISGEFDVCLNVMVMKTSLLYNLLVDAMARDLKSFSTDIIAKRVGEMDFRIYEFDGFYATVGSMEEYFHCNMQLLDRNVRNALFAIPDRAIYTKVRNSPPTKYTEGANVKNSLIADGCEIEGTVENCIIFRGTKVSRNSVVKNCILMQDTYVGKNVHLNCVIADKNVVIKDDRELSGHPSIPFYLNKGVTL
ncbi:MAG: glucose-1-phosphate adenylyltransferase subunit GlgD, partial [Clostridia bacterium]|nr:glucose-1-phosphate adenylyltransferase subunit GlgD [Clostridia bacterium]